MYGTPRRGEMNTPRLPAIGQQYPDPNSQFAFLDHSQIMQTGDDRRNFQILDEQIKVITSVCKKLNQDIEALDGQLNEKTFTLNNLEFKTNDLQDNNISVNKDLQFKLSRHDAILNKLESEHMSLFSQINDLKNQFHELNRNQTMRINDVDNRILELNNKFESIMMEQTIVLKNVEGDTVKQLQLIDGKTRTMLDDIRSQLNLSKTNHEADLSRLESRLLVKIDESARNTEKYDRIDRKLEDYTQMMNKRFLSFEDEFQRSLSKLSSSTDKLENKVNRGMDDRLTKANNEAERMKRDLKLGFENVQESILALQKLVDGKIKLSEDKLEKEMDKIRKMVVLM